MATSSMTQGPVSARYQIVLVGDQGSGKSTLQARFVRSKYFAYPASATVDFMARTVQVRPNARVLVLVWDTPSKPSLHSLVTWRLTAPRHAVVVVYSCASRTSFEAARAWLGQAQQTASQGSLLFLVATHVDTCVVPVLEGRALADSFSAQFFAVAAHVPNPDIETAFFSIVEAIHLQATRAAVTTAPQQAVRSGGLRRGRTWWCTALFPCRWKFWGKRATKGGDSATMQPSR